jgi:hypothetical protein
MYIDEGTNKPLKNQIKNQDIEQKISSDTLKIE